MPGHRETWAAVPDTDGTYLVSSRGRVKRATTGLILSPAYGPKGHLTVSLSVGGARRSVHVATLVAHAFIGPPGAAGATLKYRDGNPSHCSAANLEWTTQAEVNRKRKWYRKLSDEAVDQIRAAEGRESSQILADRHGISTQSVRNIWRQKTYPTED